jgi:hypothetical protein
VVSYFEGFVQISFLNVVPIKMPELPAGVCIALADRGSDLLIRFGE